jgi:hypothetical protein
MSIEENTQIVMDFFADWGAAIGKHSMLCPPKTSSGSFRARTGRSPAHTVGTRG